MSAHVSYSFRIARETHDDSQAQGSLLISHAIVPRRACHQQMTDVLLLVVFGLLLYREGFVCSLLDNREGSSEGRVPCV